MEQIEECIKCTINFHKPKHPHRPYAFHGFKVSTISHDLT